MPSTRLLPEQFAAGLTLDGTRISRNIEEAEKLRSVPPHLTERRFMPSWLVWGYSPDRTATPQELPWMREKNSIDVSGTYPTPTLYNEYRHKGVYTPGIVLTGSSNYYTWEVSFQSTTPTYLTRLACWLATDIVYNNTLVYGAPTPPTKVLADYLSDMTFQVFVDDLLDPEARTRTSVEAGSFQADLGTAKIVSVAGAVADTMQPPHPIGAQVDGVCLDVQCQVLLPPGRVRIALTLPRYDSAVYTTSWGDIPWQNAVWSINAKISEGCQ
ncbi:hypothetical protein UFOVP777_12 [uncultured Caudovirales phage]|uniref:Uncharacterized protein n=1 Tax=uncultured Caudovirales phage TaxID=2100421 RepID=A0A6J5NY88_9CAUD|nr:hypothetical protein UFOVP777_12 [uncultured Caudovirales phage]